METDRERRGETDKVVVFELWKDGEMERNRYKGTERI
jgi:hypothetical protein